MRTTFAFPTFFLLLLLIISSAASSSSNTKLNFGILQNVPGIPIAAMASLAFLTYNARIKKIVKANFVALELLARILTIEDDNTKATKLAEALPALLVSMRNITSGQQETQIEDMCLLWEGQMTAKEGSAGDEKTTMKDGWYVAGRGETPLYTRVEGTALSVYAPKALVEIPIASDDWFVSKLLAKRKPCTVVEDLSEKMAWLSFLKNALQEKKSTIELRPGRFRFLYRENVNAEEFLAMIARRKGLTNLRFVNDSVLVLQENGHCYLEDYFANWYGVLPVTTHNTGEWSNDDRESKIVWDKNSVRYGWRGIFGRTKEIAFVTKILRAAPWELKPCKLGSDKNGLLMHRPGRGWLVWERLD